MSMTPPPACDADYENPTPNHRQAAIHNSAMNDKARRIAAKIAKLPELLTHR
jgi:hypothetical protein